MCSRFTEIFDFNKTWENCQSDSSLPSSWTSGDTLFSSTETLRSTAREIDSFSELHAKGVPKNSILNQTQPCAAIFSTDGEEPPHSSKQQLKSKLKRFLTTIGNSRRQEKSN